MYGWRAKIGRISPSPETVGAEEWRRSMPDGVCLVETRTLLYDVTVDGLSETAEQVERAALELASAEVDVILQAGTAIAFFRGFGHDRELSRRIYATTGIQATTSLTAVVEALRTLRIMHYAAWLARRWEDPAFKIAFPWFETHRYWEDHVLALREQVALMEEEPLTWLED